METTTIPKEKIPAEFRSELLPAYYKKKHAIYKVSEYKGPREFTDRLGDIKIQVEAITTYRDVPRLQDSDLGCAVDGTTNATEMEWIEALISVNENIKGQLL